MITGNVNLTFRDLGDLPSDDRQFDAFFRDVIGPHVGLLIKEQMDATRTVENPDMTSRGVSGSCSVSFDF